MTLKFGFVIPGGDAKTIPKLAVAAEKAAWDGVFYYDGISIKGVDIYSSWPMLAAIAVSTSKVRIGSFLTAVARRNPWELALEATTVDHLSNGRLTIPVGLGTLDDGGYTNVGLPVDRKSRAERLDEGLAILEGLWSGKSFGFRGKHFDMEKMALRPRPLQRPRVPIWVVGAWQREKSLRRALRFDGIIPTKISESGKRGEITPEDVASIREYAKKRRKSNKHFDIIVEGRKFKKDLKKPIGIVRSFENAGATWWVDSLWDYKNTGEVEEMINRGPPRSS
jgi:alkanesulfonate monooxygenase SsuD/methylene tetrahydromethanopterin reductase-like flavin-dependent oxidoreductase (luciferase family)